MARARRPLRPRGCLRFYSRLPVPQLPGEPDPHRVPDFTALPRMLPLAGLILALPAALVLAAGWWIGLGPFLAATLAVAVMVLATGALHEDGLADVADGFGGGGATLERRLEIMRDSRIGAYGGAALVLALALRIGALATLLDRTGYAAATALILVAALSRLAALAPMVLLPPARPGGLSASVGRPNRASLWVALAIGLAVALGGVILGLPLRGVALMILCARPRGPRADPPRPAHDRRPDRGRDRRLPADRRDRRPARPRGGLGGLMRHPGP